ncbi:DUF2007 domain-containing protein [Flavihumibacter rivuli]|uniref:putative signal transducing protein n=1 Tax=Flavihumibacter rivuli TaxID=2838156 RepID=UPI001BDF5180|nr:DUF2007 domain-containing protein [Flavihumibacter rivuli]ULQ55624.1 DUF2007 domain-containing protein [Flavihumibacter rivuli]
MQFIQLGSFDNYLEANMRLNLLKDAGINCYLKDEYTITIDPLLSPAIGGMKLMVVEEDVEWANEVLSKADQAALGSIPCPDCGQHTLEKILILEKEEGWLSRILHKINGSSPVTALKYGYRCKSCGKSYDHLPA